MKQLSEKAIKSPKFYIWLSVIVTMLIMTLVAIPTLTGKFTSILSPLKVDTDPENMLVYDEPVRVINREKKKKFAIYDLLVVGITNKTHKNGVFNKKTLGNVYDLANYAKSLQWKDKKGKPEGVISVELISPSSVDHMEQGGPGTVKFNWLMAKPPATDQEALEVMAKAKTQPILDGSLTSTDGQALALYIPMTSKSVSYKISKLLKARVEGYKGSDEIFVTGMAIAQDTFGVEMFQQMATATPLAMMLIFALLWFFFRNATLVSSLMIVAMLATMATMGLMVITGNPIHIASSMVPIFIMPIAVLDGIHILSEFYDRYNQFKDRKKTIQFVMSKLWKPMLLTTVTTAVGFAALMLMPLPPLQVFGAFISVGVIFAWFFTMTIVPAYIMLMPERKFAKFGAQKSDKRTYLDRVLGKIGTNSMRLARPIVWVMILLTLGSLYGATKLVPNDNPMNWFTESHELHKADKVLNEKFAGSYMAYLSLKANQKEAFKYPDMLKYINNLQSYITDSNKKTLGKTIGVTEIIKTVHRELFSGDQKQYRIPDSRGAVAQTLLTFQNSHRPNDLWHYVTPDYQEANIWFQLKSGDNQDLTKIENLVDQYLVNNPPPSKLEHKWYGLTHINIIWQDYLILGMVKAFAASFLIIFVTLVILFRSFLWGLLAMIPLTFSALVIYGVAGFISGNLDAPLAYFSAISLGLAVDYAIHFIVRSKELRENHTSWRETIPAVFGEPSRAITRNVIVVGIGFMPLLITPLVPYQMTGLLISSILILAGIATLLVLPALIKLFEKRLFKTQTVNNEVLNAAGEYEHSR